MSTAIRLARPRSLVGSTRPWWLQEALAADPGEPCPALVGEMRADIAVVGGGYTGMWAALRAAELDSSAVIVLLEADICGGGPSGRNGGFCYGLWEDLDMLTSLFGHEDALRVGFAADDAIAAGIQTLHDAGVDCWHTPSGYLTVSTSAKFDEELVAVDRACRAYRGLPGDYFTLLDADAVAARVRSPRFRSAILARQGATVQPARLARGLRRMLLERGVRIFEQTPVRTIAADQPVRIDTPRGSVVADQAVVGINAWSDQLPGMRRRIVSRASHIVLTEPAPDKLAEIGWTGGEGIDDLRSTVDYVRTTPDGRIAFGQGTGDAAHANKRRLSHDPEWTRRITERLHDWFPEFRDVPIAASWGGPVDVSPFHLPFFVAIGAGNVHSAAGYSGSGVGASMLCGRILASRVLGRADEFADLPLAHYRPKAFPPGPVFGPGAKLVLPAVVRAEDAWERDEHPGAWSRFWARMPRRLGYNLGP